MTVLAIDDFDRVGALGSLWTTYSGAWTCDGDRAKESGLPGVTNLAAMAVALGASDLYPRRVSVKVQRPKLNAGSVEFGLLVSPFSNSPILNVKEVGWRSASGGQIFIRTRSLLPAVASFTDQTTVAYAWPEGEVRTLRADVFPGGAFLVNVYVDDVLIGSAPISTTVGLNIAGLYSFRSSVAAPSAAAEQPLFDLFKVQNFTASFSSELPPSPVADPTLTSLSIDGEGLIASAVALPIRAPDKAWPERHKWATAKTRMAARYVVRFPLASQKRRAWAFSWSGLTDAEVATLRTFFDTTPGPAGLGTWTTPEGQVLYFALEEPQWEIEGTGPITRRITVRVQQVYAT